MSKLGDPEPRSRSFKTLEDYRAAGVLDPKPVAPSWLVRTASGGQFSTHRDEAEAKRWADKINGTYEWYEPVQAQALTPGETYDH